MTLELIYRVYYKGEELWEGSTPRFAFLRFRLPFSLNESTGVLRTVLIVIGVSFHLEAAVLLA